MIGHLNNFKAWGVFLLICLPSQVDMSKVFRADRTARFVKDITWIKPTWRCWEDVQSSFFRGVARQNMCLVEVDFGVERVLSFN